MRLIPTIAAVLTLFAASVSLSACADKATQARRALSTFTTTCPNQLKTEFQKDAGMASLGDTLLSAYSTETCTCITDKLHLMPVDDMIQMIGDDAPKDKINALVTPCAVIAFKPRIADVCMAGAKQGGVPEDAARPRCDCMQRQANEMSDDRFTAAFGGDRAAAMQSLVQGCVDSE